MTEHNQQLQIATIEKAHTEELLLPLQNKFDFLLGWVEKYRLVTTEFFIAIRPYAVNRDLFNLHIEHMHFRKKLLALLEELAKTADYTESKEILRLFHANMAEKLQSIPAMIARDQKKERFIGQPGDGAYIQILKAFKKVLYALYVLPAVAKNKVKKLLKKKASDLPMWKHNIPVHKLAYWFYENDFLSGFEEIAVTSLKDISCLTYEVWKVDDKVYEVFKKLTGAEDLAYSKVIYKIISDCESDISARTNELTQEISQKKKQITTSFSELMEQVRKKFQLQSDIAGTIEFNRFRHIALMRKIQRKRMLKAISFGMKRRFNTLYVLSDDWEFNQEIFIQSSNILKTLLQFNARLNTRVENMNEALEEVPAFLEKTLIGLADTDVTDVRKKILQLKYFADKTLNNGILVRISELLATQNYPAFIEETEQDLIKGLSQWSQKRSLIPGFDPASAYPDKALKTISLAELVEFSMVATLKKHMLKSKTFSISELESLNNHLGDLGRMVVFSLDTALAMLEDTSSVRQSCLQEAHSGITRAKAHFNEINLAFGKYAEELKASIGHASVNFSNSLEQLTDNSRVEAIRSEIARARMRKRSQQLSGSISGMIRTIHGRIREKHATYKRNIFTAIETIRGQLGLQRLAPDISSELTEFLGGDQEKLNRFPFIYRRLFHDEPLTETTFYLHRSKESEVLKIAFEKWQKGLFVPVLIVGEKGSGISTFITIFSKKHFLKKPTKYTILPNKRINTEEELLELLGNSLRQAPFNGFDDFFAFVGNLEPFIIVFEKLHLMYLRQPGGFATLKKFFEVVSQTSKRIFWICTCGVYASEYLNRSAGMYGYFPFRINMGKLEIAEIKKVIMLRHKASGFKLSFNPGAIDLTDRSYLKRNEEKRQEYLEAKYFEAMNRLTESNISFALQLWLRSAEKLADNTIYLISLYDFDFSFVRNMPEDAVFGMQALLLHEQLDAGQFARVTSTQQRQAGLLLMRLADRGIVIDSQGSYSLNPLLYRQVLNLLKDKNLIH